MSKETAETDQNVEQARTAFRQHEWEGAANQARGAFECACRAWQNADLNLPIAAPLSGGGPFRVTKPVDPIHPQRYE